MQEHLRAICEATGLPLIICTRMDVGFDRIRQRSDFAPAAAIA